MESREYTYGELLEDLRADALGMWHQEQARSSTLTAATEQHVRAIEVEARELLSGVTHVEVRIECYRQMRSDSYYWRVINRPDGRYIIDRRSLR